MEIRVFELRLKVFLLKPVKQEDGLCAVASLIDQTLAKNPEWLTYHKENKYKRYCFNNLYPIEKDGIYKREKVYQCIVRTISKELAEYLMIELPRNDTQYMKGLVCDIRIISRRHITSLYTLTPVIVKSKNGGYWKDDLTFQDLEERLKTNIIKKYADFVHTKLDESFQLYTRIELTSKKPIGVSYKDIKLLGDKLQLEIADNPMAQILAYMTLGTGLCEMNSRGFGFVNCHFL